MTHTTNTPNTSVTLYVLLTFIWSWSLWIPLALSQVPVKETPWFYLMLLGGPTPSIIGLLLILKHKVSSRQHVLSATCSFKRLGLAHGIGSFVLIPGVFFASLLFNYLVFRTAPSFQGVRALVVNPISLAGFLFFAIYSGPLTEEFGWRGYALSVMRSRWSLLSSSLIIGVVWSVWHYPLFFLNGQYAIEQYWLTIPLHLLKHISLSLIIGFFFYRTNGSILSAILIHGVSNAVVRLSGPLPVSADVIYHGMLIMTALLCLHVSWTQEQGGRSTSILGREPR